MKKYWIKDLKDNQCIHAHTKKITKKLCKKFHSLGLTWRNGDSYLNENKWDRYKEETVYYPSKGVYSNTWSAWCSSINASEVITIDRLYDFDNLLKGFIEVTGSAGNPISININHIKEFHGQYISLCVNRETIYVRETYEEIKQLIQQAL